MFSRSLKVFVVAFGLVLLAVLVFGALRLHGPEETLQEAQAHFDRGEYARTIDVLNNNEFAASMRKDPSKRARLLRMRYAANSHLDNAIGALNDLEKYLQMPGIGKPDPDLLLDQIRLLAITGAGDRALQLARVFLQTDPENERALELAGEACQTAYREELTAVFGTIARELGAIEGPPARTALLAYLYRPDGDPEVAQGIENLRLAYSPHSRLVATWPTLQRRLGDLRAKVQEGLHFFQHSLEAGGEPVAAMRAFALSLDQSQRTDDLLIFCESYRQRFHHPYVLEAGATAAWAQIRAGQYRGALATTLRWLPPNTLAARLENGQIDPAIGLSDLLLARSVAAYRLGDRPALDRLAADFKPLNSVEPKPQQPISLTYAFLQAMRGDWKNADGTTRGAVYYIMRDPVPVSQQDLLPELMPLRLRAMRESGASDADQLAMLGTWAKARPSDKRPLLAQAQFQLDHSQPAAALVSLDEAALFAPNDEEVFKARLQASAMLAHELNQDGEALLLQCVRRKVLFPEVQNPTGFVLCAQAALEHGQPDIARESANYAIDKFPAARLPRLLKGNAELLAERPAEAARILRQLLDDFPTDAEIAALAVQACRQAGLPLEGLLAAAMRTCEPSPDLTAELLRAALRDDRTDATAFLPKPLPGADNPELAILCAHVLARAGRSAEAQPLLASLAPTAADLPAPRRAELAAALVATWTAAAATADDATLHDLTSRDIVQFSLATAAAAPALLHCSREFEKTQPQTAYGLCTTAFAAADPEQRTGADLVFAGQLAMRLGRFELAIDHWTAAVAFADGRAAAESLARLCIATGHTERAQHIYQLVTSPTDGALALRTGDATRAKTLVSAALARDGADLLANVVLACLGQPSLAADLTMPGDSERKPVLELASLLDIPDLGSLALATAQALAAAQPQSTTAQLLLARALLATKHAPMAATIHAKLFAQKTTGPMLWREIALAAGTDGYVVSPALATAVAQATAQQQTANSPVTLIFSVRNTADAMQAAGRQDLADQFRTTLWTTQPGLSKPTVADGVGLAARNHPIDAWWVLDKIRPTLAGSERRECVAQMFAIAESLARQKAIETELLCQAARRFLDEEGPQGCILYFLLDHGGPFESCRLDDAATLRWLLRHLDRAAAGDEPPELLERTVQSLTVLHGRAETIADVENAIAAHPTCLQLWQLRAGLLVMMQRAFAGIADLRAVLRHAADPNEHLVCTIRAAAAFALNDDDVAQLQNLPPALRNSPQGALAAGITALRRGDPVAAQQQLSKAEPQADGLHLVALALAQLQSATPDGLAAAQTTLQQLANDYPSSSLARYAGSFARQLAPR